jgi:hypothetical protein
MATTTQVGTFFVDSPIISAGVSTSSQPDILIGLGKETLVGTSGVNYFTFQTRKASALRSLTRIENFNQPEGDRLIVSSTPKALYNTGKLNAGSLLAATETAYRDKNKRQPGNQALKRNEAVLFRYKSSSYLSINNKSGGFAPNQDFLVNLTTPVLSLRDNKSGILSVSNYFA